MTVVGTSTKLRCVSIIFYSLDGYGLANPYLHVDSELIDPQRCTEIDAYHIDPSRPIVGLDGRELTEQSVQQSGGTTQTTTASMSSALRCIQTHRSNKPFCTF